MTTNAVWLGLGVNFGNPYMEAILSCRVPRKLNTIWDKTSKLKTGEVASSKEPSSNDEREYKESVSTR